MSSNNAITATRQYNEKEKSLHYIRIFYLCFLHDTLQQRYMQHIFWWRGSLTQHHSGSLRHQNYRTCKALEYLMMESNIRVVEIKSVLCNFPPRSHWKFYFLTNFAETLILFQIHRWGKSMHLSYPIPVCVILPQSQRVLVTNFHGDKTILITISSAKLLT